MKAHAAALSIVLTLALAGPAAAAEPSAATHVRPINAAGAALMADAQQKSQTIRDLVATLEASDVIAYVRPASRQVGEVESDLRFLASSKVQRFVLIKIGSDRSADRQVELLGHELRHAVEVAQAKWVKDGRDFGRFYVMIGSSAYDNGHPYETADAHKAELAVHRDLRAATATQD
ncbi:MAG: hypothetical protein NTY02_08875 [Acidobacteria bacterium]|nr:hypothetical protein [Acidobacteriota bacterium]